VGGFSGPHGGILGYAQFPGGSDATDGVVMIPIILENRAASHPYNLGELEAMKWVTDEPKTHLGDASCGNDFS
jgi:hypothetical protein